MITKRTSLAFTMAAAGMLVAAAPAQAGTDGVAAAATAAEGAIDMSKVTSVQTQGEDAQFTELFARWESPNAIDAVVAPQVSVPSRMPLEDALRFATEIGETRLSFGASRHNFPLAVA